MVTIFADFRTRGISL